jgi:hypothetical protein
VTTEKTEEEPITVFMCGTGDCDHVWDGPGIEWDTGEAATCSKCGVDAMTHSLWNGP